MCEAHVRAIKICQSTAQPAPLVLIKMAAVVSENNSNS